MKIEINYDSYTGASQYGGKRVICCLLLCKNGNNLSHDVLILLFTTLN